MFYPVFEELGFFGRHWQILHEISLRAIQFSSKSELSLGMLGHVKVPNTTTRTLHFSISFFKIPAYLSSGFLHL